MKYDMDQKPKRKPEYITMEGSHHKYPPGSLEAVKIGCECPRHANHEGLGATAKHLALDGIKESRLRDAEPRRFFTVNQDCQLHGLDAKMAEKRIEKVK